MVSARKLDHKNRVIRTELSGAHSASRSGILLTPAFPRLHMALLALLSLSTAQAGGMLHSERQYQSGTQMIQGGLIAQGVGAGLMGASLGGPSTSSRM